MLSEETRTVSLKSTGKEFFKKTMDKKNDTIKLLQIAERLIKIQQFKKKKNGFFKFKLALRKKYKKEFVKQSARFVNKMQLSLSFNRFSEALWVRKSNLNTMRTLTRRS